MDRRRFLELSLVTVAGGKLAACSHGGGDEAALAPVLSQTVAYAFDNAGNRYEMDFEAYVVRRVDANGNAVWTQGDVANPDLFNSPTSMAIDNDGTVFVADRGNGEIERLSAAGTPLATFATELVTADDLALDQGTLYVSDGSQHHVQVYSTSGASLRVIGAFGTSGGGLNGPRGVGVSPSGELHVVDSGNARVQVFGLDGTFRRSYGNDDSEDKRLRRPRDIVFDSSGHALVSDPLAMRLARYGGDGALLEHVQLRDAAGNAGVPLYLAIGPGDRLYATVLFQ